MRRLGAELVAEHPADLVVREGQHPAVGVADHERLLRAEEGAGDHERAERVVGDDPAGVPDHVGVALLEPERLRRVDAGVHAGDHREPAAGRHRQVSLGELRGVRVVGGLDGVELGHGGLPSGGWWSQNYTKGSRELSSALSDLLAQGALTRRRVVIGLVVALAVVVGVVAAAIRAGSS